MGEDTVRQRKVGGGDAGVAGDDQPRKGSGADREDDVSWLSYLSGSAWLVLAFAVASYFVFVSVAHQKEVLGAAGEVDSDLFSSRKEAITALLAFYQEAGIRLDGVTLHDFGPEEGIGFVATRDLPVAHVAVQVPYAAIVAPSSDREVAKALKRVSPNARRLLGDPNVALALQLVALRHAPGFAPAAAIPGRGTLVHPVLVSEEAMVAFDAPLRASIRRVQARFEETWEALASEVLAAGAAAHNTLFPPHVFTKDAFRWAYAAASTHGVSRWEQRILVPGLSRFNHHPRAWSMIDFDQEAKTVTATVASHRAGDQVYISYGLLSNEDLFFSYGLTAADNSYNRIDIVHVMPDDTSLRFRKVGLLAEAVEAPESEFLLNGRVLSKKLLAALRIECLSSDDIDAWDASNAVFMVSTSNCLCALGKLQTLVQRERERLLVDRIDSNAMPDLAEPIHSAAFHGHRLSAERLAMVDFTLALAAERARDLQASYTNQTIQITRHRPHVGAEVRGIDLTQPLDANATETLRAALVEHQLLIVRGQYAMRPDDQVRFASYFGTGRVEKFPARQGNQVDNPFVFQVANRIENGYVGVGPYWHCDGSMRQFPSDISMWRIIAVPEEGGETWFSNLYAAYDQLAQLGLDETHKDALAAAGNASWQDLYTIHRAGAMRKLVSAHPITGRNCVHVNIAGITLGLVAPSGANPSSGTLDPATLLPQETSDAVMAAVERVMTDESLAAYRHVWRAGDVVVAENHSVAHQASFCDPRHLRVLNRVSVHGEYDYGLHHVDVPEDVDRVRRVVHDSYVIGDSIHVAQAERTS